MPGPKQALSAEKDTDIRDSLSIRETQGIRYSRSMELVWCAVPMPIGPSANEDETIEFWPGIIEDFRTKASAIPVEPPPSPSPTSPGRAPDDAHKPKINWKPQQRRMYRVRFLCTEHVHTISDDAIIPYLAYCPEFLVEKMRDLLPEMLMTSKAEELANIPEKMSSFDPLAAAQPGDAARIARWKEAILPFSLAIQIASYLSNFWTPTDEWDCKFTINAPATPPLSSDHTPSLNDIINNQTNGGSDAVPRIVTQLRYQGLWWGAERIWTEELVRLKLSRNQFVPQGSNMVYPPASPSKSTLEWNKEHGLQVDPMRTGSADKGLFMKIDGLFVVEVPSKDGSGNRVKECRASGMIYELVDIDWEPPKAPNGKGKERADGASASQPMPSSRATTLVGEPDSVSAPLTPSSKPRPVLTATYPLPDAPKGYKFNPILPPGHEVVLSLSLISGRYYPRLLYHPGLLRTLQRAAQVPVEQEGLLKNKHLWAMEGIIAGVHQCMDPEVWKPSRGDMIVEADRAARLQFKLAREQHLVKREQLAQDHVMQDMFVPVSSESISMAGY